MGEKAHAVLELAGREVRVSSPDKLYYPAAGFTKLDVVNYYVAVHREVLRTAGGRPLVLKRYVDGAAGEAFYQKRAPKGHPDWITTVTLSFPSGRTAEEIVLENEAQLAWIVQLGCIELHVHPVRAADLEHPDELRIDLDPIPGVEWPQIREVAVVTRAVLAELGLVGFPKTSGSRGLHVYVPIAPRWSFSEVRRAALAIAREVEARAPGVATSKWWKEERRGVFLDYNQNAKDRTMATAYSLRATPDARVSTPIDWDELATATPADFTLKTVVERLIARDDPYASMRAAEGTLDAALELVARHEGEGQGDAPWPPHFAKQASEPKRVMPSRDKDRPKPDQTRKKAGKAASPATEADAPAPTEPKSRRRKRTDDGADREAGAAATDPKSSPKTRRGRVPKMPLVIVAESTDKAAALAGLDRWKARHPSAAAKLEPADVLVDSMRGRYSTWTRIRVNLTHVPEEQRPPQETPDPDDAPDLRPPERA